jgi:hypothetical protein
MRVFASIVVLDRGLYSGVYIVGIIGTDKGVSVGSIIGTGI